MAIWQWALLLLGCVWAMQTLGVWLQMRHYSDVFKGITNKYNDGFVGAGHVRGRLAKGTIALVVVTPDLIVQRVMTMSGRSVFAKFMRQERYEGMTLAQLKEVVAAAESEGGKKASADLRALAGAIAQVDKVRLEGKGGASPALKPALA